MDDARTRIERAVPELQRRARDGRGAARLAVDATNPLRTLSPELVALIVGRARVGASTLGDDHPRAAITKRIVVPSTVLAVLDAAGLVIAAISGNSILAAGAGVLLAILLYLAFAGVRFVAQDPLRVSEQQRARVAAAKSWRTTRQWTSEGRVTEPARLVDEAGDAAGRIVASPAWAWASIASLRGAIELADVLDSLDGAAFAAAGAGRPDDALAHRVAALGCAANALDELVARAAATPDLATALPSTDHDLLSALLTAARSDEVLGSEPS